MATRLLRSLGKRKRKTNDASDSKVELSEKNPINHFFYHFIRYTDQIFLYVKLKNLDGPPDSLPLRVSRWLKKSKKCLPKMVPVILVGSRQADVWISLIEFEV